MIEKFKTDRLMQLLLAATAVISCGIFSFAGCVGVALIARSSTSTAPEIAQAVEQPAAPPTNLPPPTSTPEPTASATPTVEPTATHTPESTPTVEPTATHTPESTRTAEPTATSTPIVEPTQPAEPIFLTVENSEEFAAFINSELEGGPLIEEFVSNNIGNTIVFEGNIAYMNNHGNYDTRYDILIYTGDYSETSGSGPKFKFENVNIYDLHLSGDNIPDTIGMGLNTIFTAEIVEFRDQTQITFLKPVKTEIR